MAVVDPILLRTYDYGVIGPSAAKDPVWQDVPVQSLAPHKYLAQKHLFPFLCEWARIDATQRVAISEAQDNWSQTQNTPFIGLLINAARAIRPRLTRALVIKRQDMTDRLLRYYDPRVYQHLRWILDTEQRAWLMDGATAWAWPDREGQWQVDEAHEVTVQDNSHAYTEIQLAQFERIEFTERAYRRLKEKAPKTVANEQQAVKRLDTVLATAMQHYGLHADRDLDRYVDHVMTIHPRIHEHPAMQDRLANVLGGQSYRGACCDLDKQTLQRYAMELDHPERYNFSTAVHQ